MPNALLADISSWNGAPAQIRWTDYVAWSRMGDGKARLILRTSQGTNDPDECYQAYYKDALEAGVEEFWHYHYAYPNLNTPAAEAASFLKYLGNNLRPGDHIMLDYEEEVPEANAAWALAWLANVEHALSLTPYLYSFQAFIAERLQDARLAAYPLIYAKWTFDPSHLPPAPRPWTSYALWQYSDGDPQKGGKPVPGFSGNVDQNVFVGATPPTGGTMTLPSGWAREADGSLSNPSGIPVHPQLAPYIEQHAWETDNVPLPGGARQMTVLEPGNPAIGSGLRQDFRWASLGLADHPPQQDASLHQPYRIWTGQDLSVLGEQVSTLTEAATTKDAEIADLKTQLQAAEAALKTAQAGQPPAPAPQTPQEAVLAAVKVLGANWDKLA